MNRFLLLDIVPPHLTLKNQAKRLHELVELTATYGRGEVVKIIQQKIHPDPATYIGKGKLEEVVTKIIPEMSIKTIIANEILKPKQLFNIKRALWDRYPNVDVWDRVDLILHIFKNHARTAESKLQIELAAMRHMGPRIYNLTEMLGRQRSSRGTVGGAGETNTQQMQYHWKISIATYQKKLEKLESHRLRHLERRKELGLKTVSIVGYTNAGKSTLFNRLTGKHKLVKDALFATLDSATGKMYLPESRRSILVSDTIGFIRDLPPELIQAFRSTLLETVHADIIIHVVDASDPQLQNKINTVEKTLDELQVTNTPTIVVFNKIDKATHMDRTTLDFFINTFSPVFVSSQTGDGIPDLLHRIEELLPVHTPPIHPVTI